MQELVLVVPDLDKKNENGSRHFRLGYRRGVINGGREKMETSHLPFKAVK